jgi:hypothetical protein
MHHLSHLYLIQYHSLNHSHKFYLISVSITFVSFSFPSLALQLSSVPRAHHPNPHPSFLRRPQHSTPPQSKPTNTTWTHSLNPPHPVTLASPTRPPPSSFYNLLSSTTDYSSCLLNSIKSFKSFGESFCVLLLIL